MKRIKEIPLIFGLCLLHPMFQVQFQQGVILINVSGTAANF